MTVSRDEFLQIPSRDLASVNCLPGIKAQAVAEGKAEEAKEKDKQ
jgi:hypothetical protein